MNSFVMVRASWPAALCTSTNMQHGWTAQRHGLVCGHCFEWIAWNQCADYQRWCGYLNVRMFEIVGLLN